MKKINLFYLLMTLLLLSCSSRNYKEQLIGEWFFVEIPSMGLHFSQDSLFINSSFPTRQNWSIDETNIYLKNISDLNLMELKGEEVKSHFIYDLSKNKDTLRWRAKKDSSKTNYKFIRIKNQFEHFKRIIDFEFDLPVSNNNLIPIGNDKISPHFFIGYINDKLMIKKDKQFIDLKDVSKEVYRLELQLEKEEFEKLKINLFIDKNIPEFKIDSIKEIIRRSPIKRLFRVYKNDTIDYKKNLNWYGMYE